MDSGFVLICMALKAASTGAGCAGHPRGRSRRQ
jgi:hypothetical protein